MKYKILILFLTFFLGIETGYCLTCSYSLKYNDQQENITFEISDSSVKVKTDSDLNGITLGSTVPGNHVSIFGNEELYLDTEEMFRNVFRDSDSCSSGLSYFAFGVGPGNFDYVLVNQNTSVYPVGTLGSITFNKESSTNNPDGRKYYCGESFVVSMNTNNAASNYREQSLEVRYYMENGKKYVEINPKKGFNEGAAQVFELKSGSGEITFVDYYAKEYAAKQLRFITFDSCQNVRNLKVCEGDDGSSTFLLIGDTCKDSDNVVDDEDTDLETEKEYEENYENNFGTCNMNSYSPDTCAYYLGHVSQNNKGCPIYWINIVYQIIKYSVVAVLVILIMLDLVKALTNKEADTSTVIHRSIVRFIIVILIFITPTLIENIYQLLTGKTGILCGIK